MTPKSIRMIYGLLFLLCFLLISGIMLMEYRYHLMPCPLCVLQRLAFGALSLVMLIGSLHPWKQWGGRVYALGGILFSLLGMILAGRQIWLQHLPMNESQACVPGIGYLFGTLPFSKALCLSLLGDAHCAQVHDLWWGLSLAQWSFLCFVLFGIVMVFFIAIKVRSPS